MRVQDVAQAVKGWATAAANAVEWTTPLADAAARRQGEPISTATTESTVQRLLHRRMGANQQMRWSPRGAHRMLKVRTAVMNGRLAADYTVAEPYARRPFHQAA